jgi:hypothetical protein
VSRGIQLTTKEPVSVELQHVNVKLAFEDSGQIDLGGLIPVFHSWIQDQVCDELLLDVADYRHVPDGPGIILIGHEANYSIDNIEGRLGLRYNRKAVIAGTNQDRLEQAFRSAVRAAQRLEEDAPEGEKLATSGQEIEMWINDRLLAPNREETRSTLGSELRIFLDKLFAGNSYTLSLDPDPRRLLTARIASDRKFSVSELLETLKEPKII